VNKVGKAIASELLPNNTRQKNITPASSTQSESTKKHRKLTSSAKDGPTRSYNVLLVEDNLVNQRVMHRQLERLGCKVHVANHGLEALDILKSSVIYHHNTMSEVSFDVDVVLMDIEMPIMDGLTATQKIRVMQNKGEFLRHIPIIAITANARPKQVEDTLSAGIDVVLHKPFTLKELTEKLDAIFEQEGGTQS